MGVFLLSLLRGTSCSSALPGSGTPAGKQEAFFFHEHIARTYYEPQGGIKVLREEKQTEICIFLQGTLNSTWLPQKKHKPLSGISLLPESSQEYSAPQFRDISGECISLILFKHFLRSGLNYAWVIIYTRSCPFGAWLSNIFFEENGSQRPPPPPHFPSPLPTPIHSR